MLSILIPIYNCDISALIDQLLIQSERINVPIEVIGLDDCSSDKEITKKNRLALSKKNCVFFENESNLGRIKTRNLLANKAQFSWLLFLDSDVIPNQSNFIDLYCTEIQKQKNDTVFFGGYNYSSTLPNKSRTLRWYYGHNREYAAPEKRNKNPYSYVFSGNFVIKKSTFLKIAFPENSSYGMDIFFSYYLYSNSISAKHIHNPIIHLGLEENTIFFEKCLESVRLRKQLTFDYPNIVDINSLLKYHRFLNKIYFAPLFSISFNFVAPVLKKMILAGKPNLFCLDLYRLGYLCTLKSQEKSPPSNYKQ
jgi:glycosyltransferase involved in cell wall biosynthesis